MEMLEPMMSESIIKEIAKSAQVSKSRPQSKKKINEAEETEKKPCIYFKDMECTAPHTRMKVCENCPEGYTHCFPILVKNMFEKIKGLAIAMFNRDSRGRDVLGGK